MSWLRHNSKWAVPSGLALAGIGVWLIFGYFGFQTLFFDDEVNEDVPVFASGAGTSGLESDTTTEEEVKEMNDLMAEEGHTARRSGRRVHAREDARDRDPGAVPRFVH